MEGSNFDKWRKSKKKQTLLSFIILQLEKRKYNKHASQ